MRIHIGAKVINVELQEHEVIVTTPVTEARIWFPMDATMGRLVSASIRSCRTLMED